MARERSPARAEAEKLYLDSKGTMKLVDIAARLNLKDSQIRKWKSQDKWDNKLKGALQKNNSNVTNQKVTKRNSKKEAIADEVKEVMENNELTDKQRLFCIYYIKCFNATKAYQKAYESSYDVANAEGYKLLVKPCVKTEITKLKQNKLNRLVLSEDDIFQKYIDIAFGDITDFVEFGRKPVPIVLDNGATVEIESNYVDFKSSYEIDGTIISEVSKGKDGVKVKLQDKMKALQWLSDRMDLLPTATKEKLKLENEKVKQIQEKIDFEKNRNLKNDEPIQIVIKRKEREE